jgi:protein-S-isoprenylcysteine O-methyltransferase Ste14
VLAISVLYLRIPKEENMMIEQFGEQYREYRQRTGVLLPRI